jgi:hypothetical protein
VAARGGSQASAGCTALHAGGRWCWVVAVQGGSWAGALLVPGNHRWCEGAQQLAASP